MINDFKLPKNVFEKEKINEYLCEKLTEELKNYINEKGYWKDNELIIKSLTNDTINTLCEKIVKNDISDVKFESIEFQKKILKIAKQVCSDKIKQMLQKINKISEIKDLIKKNSLDDSKLETIIKTKLSQMDSSANSTIQQKLIKHEKQLAKYGLSLKDYEIIQKAFVTYKREGNFNDIIISDCQYLFSLYFNYGLTHKEIAENEKDKLLKLGDERKSIEKLRFCFEKILIYAQKLKYGN